MVEMVPKEPINRIPLTPRDHNIVRLHPRPLHIFSVTRGRGPKKANLLGNGSSGLLSTFDGR